jgi:hypothetical protein
MPIFHFTSSKYEEFWLWTEESGVTDTGGLQVGFGALGDGTWVTLVTLHGVRLDDVAGDHNGRLVEERIHEAVSASGIRIMSEASMPFQPAMEEPSNILPSDESAFVNRSCWEAHVLLLTT